MFRRALSNLTPLYAHPLTVVFKMTLMPRSYPRGFTFSPGVTPNTAAYMDRGWVRSR